MKETDRVVIGRINRPHGISGEVRARPYTESKDTWKTIDWIFLKQPDRKESKYRLVSYRFHQREVLLTLQGVVNREQAEELKGADISVPLDWLPEPEEGEYYWADLIGLKTIDENGRFLGWIKELLPAGQVDILVVQGDDREVLIPFQTEIVSKVDLDEKLIVVRLPEGLLEIND